MIKDYQPEVKRYGGKQNLPTIESIFCESSNLTSSFVNNINEEEKILLSLDLTSLLFNSLEIKKEDLKELYRFLHEIWASYSVESFNLKVENIDLIVKSLDERINKINYNKQEINYKSYIQEISLIKNMTYIDNDQENPVYSTSLRTFIQDRNIDKGLINAIISLAHMNFNRLLFFPHVESVIYKLLSERN